MIHLSTVTVEEKTTGESDWQTLLRDSKMTLEELLTAVEIEDHPLASNSAVKLFEIRVPRPYLQKIEKGNPKDPLLLQILPQVAEHLKLNGFSSDPLNEKHYSPAKGLIHKYKNRVLLIASHTCAINCRYCFRREFPYNEHSQSMQDWQSSLDFIRRHPEINEAILSGGDPLILNNDYLFWLLKQLDQIPHISRIRIHTRMAISLPQRIDQKFISGIKTLTSSVILVMHCNHANELGEDVAQAVKQLRGIGVTVLNQSVLLNSINASANSLRQLSESLFSIGVLPYYLFTLDKVNGATHFDIPIEKARKIYIELLASLPGYLVPKLVAEVPGRPFKTPIDLSL